MKKLLMVSVLFLISTSSMAYSGQNWTWKTSGWNVGDTIYNTHQTSSSTCDGYWIRTSRIVEFKNGIFKVETTSGKDGFESGKTFFTKANEMGGFPTMHDAEEYIKDSKQRCLEKKFLEKKFNE